MLWRHPELVIPDFICVVVCAIAVITDLRSRRIPNWLCLTGIVVGLLINTLLFWLFHGPGPALSAGLVSSLAGGLLLMITFGLLGLINFVGMGDVKLMVAVGVLLRWPTALWALAYVALSGGVIALLYALFRGRLFAVLRNIVAIGKHAVQPRKKSAKVELHRIPYALAIFIGATWAAAVKYLPALALG